MTMQVATSPQKRVTFFGHVWRSVLHYVAQKLYIIAD